MDTCVMCGEYVPEGRQVCISCEKAPSIKDSGNRRKFESGAVRDIQEGKGRYDLYCYGCGQNEDDNCEIEVLQCNCVIRNFKNLIEKDGNEDGSN